MCELCVLFWHSLPQRDTLQLYYLNLKRVRVSPKAFWPENNMRRFLQKETNKKSLAEIKLHFEAADWLLSLLWRITTSSRWKRQWHRDCVPLTFQKTSWENLKEWRLVCWIQRSLGFHWSVFCWTTIHEMHNNASVMGIV